MELHVDAEPSSKNHRFTVCDDQQNTLYTIVEEVDAGSKDIRVVGPEGAELIRAHKKIPGPLPNYEFEKSGETIAELKMKMGMYMDYTIDGFGWHVAGRRFDKPYRVTDSNDLPLFTVDSNETVVTSHYHLAIEEGIDPTPCVAVAAVLAKTERTNSKVGWTTFVAASLFPDVTDLF